MKITKGPGDGEHCCDCGSHSRGWIDTNQHPQYCAGIKKEQGWGICHIGECNPPPATPTLDKIEKVAEGSQAIGQFMEWCQEEHLILAFYPLVSEMYPERYTDEALAKPQNEWRLDNMNERSVNLQPSSKGIQTLLHLFFEIDPVAEESERRAILDHLQKDTEAAALARQG